MTNESPVDDRALLITLQHDSMAAWCARDLPALEQILSRHAARLYFAR